MSADVRGRLCGTTNFCSGSVLRLERPLAGGMMIRALRGFAGLRTLSGDNSQPAAVHRGRGWKARKRTVAGIEFALRAAFKRLG